MKKKLSIVLVICIVVLTIPFTAFAGTVQPIEPIQLNESNISAIEGLLSSSVSNGEIEVGNSLSLGEEILAYELSPTLKWIEYVQYYPVLSDGKVIAIVSLYGDMDAPTISIGEEFAKDIQDFYTQNEEIAIVYNGNDMYVTSKTDIILVKQFTYSDKQLVKSKRSAESITAEEFGNITFSSTLPKYDIALRPQMRAVTKNLPVPIKRQGNYNICWAAAIASIGQYRTGINKSATQVCDTLGTGYVAATTATARNGLSRIYGISSSQSGAAPYETDLRAKIDANKPIYLFMRNTSGGVGHAIVARGYTAGGSFQISFMDSNYSTFRTTYVFGNSITIMVGSQVMQCGHYINY